MSAPRCAAFSTPSRTSKFVEKQKTGVRLSRARLDHLGPSDARDDGLARGSATAEKGAAQHADDIVHSHDGPEVNRLSREAGIQAVVPKSQAAAKLIAQAHPLVA
jgi:hypothetical protein